MVGLLRGKSSAESAPGPSATCRQVAVMSAIGGKPENIFSF
jgi:hypothetical protein